MACQDSLVIDLNIFCTSQNTHERTKLVIDKKEVNTVHQLKTKIQDLRKAPVCDQKLSYLGQPLTDPTAKLGDLYLRDGDTLYLEFLEKVDIEEFNECLKKLRDFISSAPPCSSDGNYIHVPLMKNVDILEDLYADIAAPLESLDMKFHIWKTVQAKANRHYFVQEGGLQVLMELFGFSQKKYSWFCSSSDPRIQTAITVDEIRNNNDTSDDNDDEQDDIFYRSDELVQSFNEWQMIICSLVLQTLWNFMETGPDTRLVLNMGALQGMIDSYMKCDNYDGPSAHLAINLRESALGCLCGCVEYDKKSQLQVACNLAMMKKLARTIEPKVFFRRNECCLVANTIFYVSFNQKAIERLICSGFCEDILDKAQAWHQEFDSSLLVLITWYYCLLFLARIRSSTLSTIPLAQSNEIDSVIDKFIQEYKPRRIAEYEEQELYVWITLVPIVHMAFAAGPKSRKPPREANDELFKTKKSRYLAETAFPDYREKPESAESEPSTAMRSGCSMETDSFATELQRDFSETTEIDFGNPSTARWPGSTAVQKLAIFALQHTLHSEDNRKLLIVEDLQSYLMCLQWKLTAGTDHEKLRNELLVIADDIRVPTLKVICKSVLASMHGLDSVFKL